MTTFDGSVTEQVAADPDELFQLITDIARLPEWNEHIHHVVEAPAELADGSQWVVQMRANGARWNSRAHLEECDPVGRRFVYVSRTDDDNPSRARCMGRAYNRTQVVRIFDAVQHNQQTRFVSDIVEFRVLIGGAQRYHALM